MARDIAVGFDFDHTLGLDNKLERTIALELLETLAREHGVEYDTSAADAAIDATLARYRSGTTNVEAAIAGFFEQFAPVGSFVVDRAGDFRDAVVAAAPQYIVAKPGAREMLAQLDDLDITYAMLTNGWSPLQEEKARLIDFRGSVFVSERIGALKPSRDAFAVLEKHFALNSDRIWYVGDDPSADCAGAHGAGMRAVWFDWEARTYPVDIPKPAFTIHDLGELTALLQGHPDAAANGRG